MGFCMESGVKSGYDGRNLFVPAFPGGYSGISAKDRFRHDSQKFFTHF